MITSTISSNISVSLSKLGYSVGLIDADIFGPSIPTIFNTENEQPNYKIINEKNIIIRRIIDKEFLIYS